MCQVFFFPFPWKKNAWSQVKSKVHMRQNSTNSNKKWKQSWLKGPLLNGSILLPIRLGPTLGLTPCTPLWLGQYTSTLLSQLWLWFRLFNFWVFCPEIHDYNVRCVCNNIIGSWFRSWGFSSGRLVFHLSTVTCTSKIISVWSGIKRS